MKTISQTLADQIEKNYNRYIKEAGMIARIAQRGYINPFLDKMGWAMVCGNGGWWMYAKEPANTLLDLPVPVNVDTIPLNIVAIMEVPIPGCPADSLGTFMQNYKGVGYGSTKVSRILPER